MAPGWLVAATLRVAGQMPIREFCLWWAEETQAAVLYRFMLDSFRGAALTERHGNRMWCVRWLERGCWRLVMRPL